MGKKNSIMGVHCVKGKVYIWRGTTVHRILDGVSRILDGAQRILEGGCRILDWVLRNLEGVHSILGVGGG